LSRLEEILVEKEAVAQVVQLFLEDLVGRYRTLDAAWDAGDLEAIGEWAHSLKGTAANLSAARVIAAAEAFEKATKTTPNDLDGFRLDSLRELAVLEAVLREDLASLRQEA